MNTAYVPACSLHPGHDGFPDTLTAGRRGMVASPSALSRLIKPSFVSRSFRGFSDEKQSCLGEIRFLDQKALLFRPHVDRPASDRRAFSGCSFLRPQTPCWWTFTRWLRRISSIRRAAASFFAPQYLVFIGIRSRFWELLPFRPWKFPPLG